MSKNDQAKSISKRLSNLAKEQETGYRNIALAFYLERLLARVIADSSLKNKLVFKGGYVGLRVYESHRYTVDLDATLVKANIKPISKKITEAIESDLDDGTWFQLQEERDLLTQGEYEGVRQVYRVGLGDQPEDISRADVVHFDIGIDDVTEPKPIKTETPSILDGDTIGWFVYPIEAIIAEKIHAFVSRDGDSSRSKDIYDLAFFLPKADGKLLLNALKACFKHRKTELPKSISETMQSFDFQLTRLGWTKAISSINDSPTFEDCIDTILKELKAKVG